MAGGKKPNANGMTRYVDVAIRTKGHGDVVLDGRPLQRRTPAVRARWLHIAYAVAAWAN